MWQGLDLGTGAGLAVAIGVEDRLKAHKPTQAWGILLPRGSLVPFSRMAGC